mgnify:CR=1 FL=1
MMGKEKLYFLLDTINGKRVLTPSSHPILIHPAGDLNNHFPQSELLQLFLKLQSEEKIFEVVRFPEANGMGIRYEDGYYGLKLLSAFDKYFLKIQQEPEYQEFTGKKPVTSEEIGKPQVKPNRKGLEKIWNILQEIDEINQISPSDGKLKIPHEPRGFTGSPQELSPFFNDRETVLQKLLSLKAIENLKSEETFGSFWHFIIGKDFNKVFDEYKEKYKAIAKEYEQTKTTKETEEGSIYKIGYSEQSREILINNFLLKKLRSFSDNDAIFAYLYENANKVVSVKDIKAGTKLTSIKDLNKFLENIGFTGELRKVFFKVSKDQVRFNNPVTKKDLEEIGISYLKLR